MSGKTLVVQSHTSPLPAPWYQRCLTSVQRWAEVQGFRYRWLGDELLQRVPAAILAKTRSQPVVATDMARLMVLEEALAEGCTRSVWVDADVLILDPVRLVLPDSGAVFGREVWVQRDASGAIKVHRKIHNAFMAFQAGDPVLPFYRYSAARILDRYDPNASRMVAQLIGPKLLTLLHNAIGFDVLESAGVMSPAVAKDCLTGGGEALRRFVDASMLPPLALNLCASSVRGGELEHQDVDRLITLLHNQGPARLFS